MVVGCICNAGSTRVSWMLSKGFSFHPVKCSSIHLLRQFAVDGRARHLVGYFFNSWWAVVRVFEVCMQTTRIEAHTHILHLAFLAHTKLDNHSVGCLAGIYSMVPLCSISSISACMSFFTCTGHRRGAFTTGRAFSFNCSLPLMGNLPRPSNLSGNLSIRSSRFLNWLAVRVNLELFCSSFARIGREFTPNTIPSLTISSGLRYSHSLTSSFKSVTNLSKGSLATWILWWNWYLANTVLVRGFT